MVIGIEFMQIVPLLCSWGRYLNGPLREGDGWLIEPFQHDENYRFQSIRVLGLKQLGGVYQLDWRRGDSWRCFTELHNGRTFHLYETFIFMSSKQ